MKSNKSDYTHEELITKLEKLDQEKQEAIKNQQYALASNIRDEIRKYNEGVHAQDIRMDPIKENIHRLYRYRVDGFRTNSIAFFGNTEGRN